MTNDRGHASIVRFICSRRCRRFRMAHDGFYRRGYQLDSPDGAAAVIAAAASSQSSPRDPLAESPDVRSTADSSYSCDQEGYYTSMHKDSGLVVAGKSGGVGGSGASSTDRHSALSTSDPTKPRGDSSGDSGAEDLQEACSDDKQRAETNNTVVNAPSQKDEQASPSTSTCDFLATPTESRPNIIRPKVIDTFEQDELRRGNNNSSSTLPRQSRQPTMPSRIVEGANIDNTELDEWLLRKFQTEMVVKNRTRSASGRRTASPLHPTKSLQSADEKRQQFAQTLNTRKAVRFCE